MLYLTKIFRLSLSNCFEVIDCVKSVFSFFVKRVKVMVVISLKYLQLQNRSSVSSTIITCHAQKFSMRNRELICVSFLDYASKFVAEM